MPNQRRPARLWLKRRPGGADTWIIIDGGRQFGTGCRADDIAGADQALQAHLAQRFRPDTGQRDAARIPIAEILALHGQLIAPHRPQASRATTGYHIKALLGFWGARMLADVKGSTCRAYVESRPVMASTARQELKTLQAAINTWHRESPLQAVPRVTLPPAGPPRERFLERHEVAALLRACRVKRGALQTDYAHVARVIRLGLATGTRIGALTALTWQRGLAGGTIDVERGILYRRGAREAETSKRRPPVQLDRKTLAMCRRWKAMDEARGQRHVISYNGQGLRNIHNAWATVRREAGLGDDVTPHTLRHTCATWMLNAGVSLWDVARHLGADASTIERVYGHHSPPERQKQA